MTRPTVVTGTIHPGSESGTCFRANDEMGAGRTKWARHDEMAGQQLRSACRPRAHKGRPYGDVGFRWDAGPQM